MEEAPKKPSRPLVCSTINATSGGSAIGPPVAKAQHVAALVLSGVYDPLHEGCRLFARSSRCCAPMDPFVVSPACATSRSAPARVISARLFVRRIHTGKSAVPARARGNHLGLQERTPSRSPRDSVETSRRSDPPSESSGRPRSQRRAVGAERGPSTGTGRCRDPGERGMRRTMGSTSRAMSSTIALASPYGISPARRPASSHAEASGVVDDDQVGAARLGAFGR